MWSTNNITCQLNPLQEAFAYLNDIITVLVGPPLAACLLWHAFTTQRNRLDVLNINLALFHTCQYAMSAAHLCIMKGSSDMQNRLLNFQLAYAQIGGPMSLCLICMERYVAVVRPTDYPRLEAYRFREFGAATVWLLSLTTAISIMESVGTTTEWLQSIRKNAPFLLMLIMILLLYKCSSAVANVLRMDGPGGKTPRPAKRRALFTVAATCGLVLLCYIPVAIMMHLTEPPNLQCLLIPLCIALLSMASVVHPALYLYTRRKTLSFKAI